MGVSLEEQETVISIMRDEKTAHISTSDSTMKTKLDKRVEANPEEWKVIDENEYYKFYECPKNFISFRSKKVTKELTEEQKRVYSERLKKYQEEKSAQKSNLT